MEWERLEISSRKLEIPREHSCKDGHNKVQKWQKAEDIKKRWQEYTDMHIIWISQLIWLKVTYSEITMKSQGMEYCSESESLVLTFP